MMTGVAVTPHPCGVEVRECVRASGTLGPPWGEGDL